MENRSFLGFLGIAIIFIWIVLNVESFFDAWFRLPS